MSKDTKLFTVSISQTKHPNIRQALDQASNGADLIRTALTYYLDHKHLDHNQLSSKDRKLLEHLKAFGTWDILLPLSEKGMLANQAMFFETMLKAIQFSQSVFQSSETHSITKEKDNSDEIPQSTPSIFDKGAK